MNCKELREEIVNKSFERIIQYIKNNPQNGKVELKLFIGNRHEIHLSSFEDYISLPEDDFNSLRGKLGFAGYIVSIDRKACTFTISGW